MSDRAHVCRGHSPPVPEAATPTFPHHGRSASCVLPTTQLLQLGGESPQEEVSIRALRSRQSAPARTVTRAGDPCAPARGSW